MIIVLKLDMTYLTCSIQVEFTRIHTVDRIMESSISLLKWEVPWASGSDYQLSECWTSPSKLEKFSSVNLGKYRDRTNSSRYGIAATYSEYLNEKRFAILQFSCQKVVSI